MKTYVVDNICETLMLGRKGENAVTQIAFDFSPWQEKFGSGVFSVLIRRPGEDIVYPATVEANGTTAIWTVSNTDTDIAGLGRVNLVYTVGATIKKSAIHLTVVYDALTGTTEDAPPPYKTYVEQIVQAASAAGQSAAEAAQNADNARQSATRAAQAVVDTLRFSDPDNTGNVTISFEL